MMRTRLHLKPGQKGTKQLLAQYGDRLVCVRYRYDAQRKKRFKMLDAGIQQQMLACAINSSYNRLLAQCHR